MPSHHIRKPIEIPAILSGLSTLVAGGLSLRFSTQELKPEEELVILQHKGIAGFLLFKPDSFSEGEIPAEDTPESGFKTPSQRLRSVLYKIYMDIEGDTEFEVFYRKQMESIINHFKAKLDKAKSGD